MPDLTHDDVHALVERLLSIDPDLRAAWLASQRAHLSLELIAALKRRSDALLLADPSAADEITRCALIAAEQIADQALALPLAAWARGNWESYHDPHAAIQSYQRALAAYRASGDRLSVARLLGNLVFAHTDCGNFAEAQAAYAEACAVFLPLGAGAALYLLRLEQNYGVLLRNRGQHDEALATHERALALANQIDRPDIAAEITVNRALTLGMLGRLAEGEAAFLQSRAMAERHGQELTVARIDMNLGELYAAVGRPAESLRRLHAARDRFAALGNRMEQGSVLLREASLLDRIGALREARRSYAQARLLFEDLQMLPQVGIALTRHAAASRRYGEYAEATRLLDQAQKLWTRLDQPIWRELTELERAALALAQDDAAVALAFLRTITLAASPALALQGDLLLADALALDWRTTGSAATYDQAHTAYGRALRDARGSSDRWAERQALAGRGQLALARNPAAARADLAAAAALDDMTRQALSVEELKAGFQSQTGDVLPLLARLAIDRAQPLEGLGCAWRAKGSGLLDLFPMAAGEAEPPGARDEIERLRQQLAVLRWQHARADDTVASFAERRDPEVSALKWRLSDLRRRHNRASAGRAPGLDRPARLLERLGDAVLIEYLRCGDDLLAWRADRAGDCRAIQLPDAAAMLDLLDRLQLSFQNVLVQSVEQRARHLDAWLAECRPLLRRCYELALAPLLDDADEGRRLLIAPCDPLYLLPFAALWDGRRYLVERFELEMTPSGALLAAPPRDGSPAGPLVIASSAGGRLGYVAREAAAIALALPDSTTLVDDAQDLARLARLGTPPRVLHIAAHSIPREDAPIFAALQLAGGLLSVEQCYGMPLRGTDLVTLSGCTTATGLDTGGSLLAFQSAFLASGARRVLSSLWPIDDAATVSWMGRFYQHYAAGHAPPAALRATQRALLGEPAMAHPAIWAAFICSCRPSAENATRAHSS